MPVVINEFEIVSEPAPAPRAESANQESSQPADQGATPHDVENILRREKERLLRVKAH
jgi:hypothetical protein